QHDPQDPVVEHAGEVVREVLHVSARAEPRPAHNVVDLPHVEQPGDLGRIMGEIRVHYDDSVTAGPLDPFPDGLRKPSVDRPKHGDNLWIRLESLADKPVSVIRTIVVHDNDLVVIAPRDLPDDRVDQVDDVAGFILGRENHADLGHLKAAFSSARKTRPPWSALRST